MSKKFVYLFKEGNATMRELLGGKGANLAEMTSLGLPVPQGFTVTTEACTQYYEDGRKIKDDIQAEIMEYIDKMEEITGKKFGDTNNPLLVSVRSGARASMPGMKIQSLTLVLTKKLLKLWLQSQATLVGHMTATEDLFRCILTLLWKLVRSTLKNLSMK